jgi:nucleotide-binding universal stress UspA family protein
LYEQHVHSFDFQDLGPSSFSERCREATRYAAALACRFRSELTLLHVFAPPWAAYSAPEGYSSPAMVDIEANLELVKGELASFLETELRSFSVKRLIAEGDPARVIAHHAAALGSDLIVMPTHGYGPFRRFLLGSVTAKVLHDVSCPVFTGPHLEHPPAMHSPSFGKVLCAVDLGPQTPTVLEWARRFANEFGSELAVVHVIPNLTERMEGVYFDPAWRQDVARSAKERIVALQEESGAHGEVIIEIGELAQAVAAAAESAQANVVVIGRGHGHGVLERLRANAYGIVRESPCPVVAV